MTMVAVAGGRKGDGEAAPGGGEAAAAAGAGAGACSAEPGCPTTMCRVLPAERL